MDLSSPNTTWWCGLSNTASTPRNTRNSMASFVPPTWYSQLPRKVNDLILWTVSSVLKGQTILASYLHLLMGLKHISHKASLNADGQLEASRLGSIRLYWQVCTDVTTVLLMFIYQVWQKIMIHVWEKQSNVLHWNPCRNPKYYYILHWWG
jgi:hypothetical protein